MTADYEQLRKHEQLVRDVQRLSNENRALRALLKGIVKEIDEVLVEEDTRFHKSYTK